MISIKFLLLTTLLLSASCQENAKSCNQGEIDKLRADLQTCLDPILNVSQRKLRGAACGIAAAIERCHEPMKTCLPYYEVGREIADVYRVLGKRPVETPHSGLIKDCDRYFIYTINYPEKN